MNPSKPTRIPVNGAAPLAHQAQPAQAPAAPSKSPFGQRTSAPGSTPAPPPPPPPAPNPFRPAPPAPVTTQISWRIIPVQKAAVRFDMFGLGDPFFRVLGQPINPDYADLGKLVAAMEKGGEMVDALKAALDAAWARFNLKGAAMIYKWQASQWRVISHPTTNKPRDDDRDDDDNSTPAPSHGKPIYPCYRAIDPLLVMNVLARARTQLLIANAQPIFNFEYLNASIYTDDPRLIKLAMGTGYLVEDV